MDSVLLYDGSCKVNRHWQTIEWEEERFTHPPSVIGSRRNHFDYFVERVV